MAVKLDVGHEPVLLRPGEGEAVSERGTIKTPHELVDVTESLYEPGERGPDPHVHRHHTDSFYVLEGELELRVGPGAAAVVVARAATFVLIPPGLVHTFGNESGATARFLNFHAPSCGFAAHLRDEKVEWDSEDPPSDGGRPASDLVSTRERFDRGDRVLTILADAEQLSALTIAFDPKFVVEPHRHHDHLDSFYVLDGEVEFTVGEDVVRAGPGTWAAAPPGARHGFGNGGSRRATVLNVHAPDTGFAA